MSTPTTATQLPIAFGFATLSESITIQYLNDECIELPAWVNPGDIAEKYNFGFLHKKGGSNITRGLKQYSRYLKIIDRREITNDTTNISEILLDWAYRHIQDESDKDNEKRGDAPTVTYNDVEGFILRYVEENRLKFPIWLDATILSQYFGLGRNGFFVFKKEFENRGKIFSKLVVSNSRKNSENPNKKEYFVDERV